MPSVLIVAATAALRLSDCEDVSSPDDVAVVAVADDFTGEYTKSDARWSTWSNAEADYSSS